MDPESKKKQAEGREKAEAPSHTPMVASDEKISLPDLFGDYDKRRVTGREFFVKLQLRSEFVGRRENATIWQTHFEPLGAELDQAVKRKA